MNKGDESNMTFTSTLSLRCLEVYHDGKRKKVSSIGLFITLRIYNNLEEYSQCVVFVDQ